MPAPRLWPRSRGYAANHGLAEEIFLMQPDMVLAGTYTTRATIGLLRRLDIRVEEFAPENSFDDIRANLKRMGDLLGQPERAASLVAELDNELAALKPGEEPQRTVPAWYANSYTSGSGTLMGDIIRNPVSAISRPSSAIPGPRGCR
ncbi:ABC transporter substrate-binding protein [Mesorhizobium sp. M2A.F.Ca.ET.039.01.1.1]|nr:ABC transporter substrate-binding protein [Mesorhizobium sp. M2A.F.Ca.ET.039.01.1.1]